MSYFTFLWLLGKKISLLILLWVVKYNEGVNAIKYYEWINAWIMHGWEFGKARCVAWHSAAGWMDGWKDEIILLMSLCKAEKLVYAFGHFARHGDFDTRSLVISIVQMIVLTELIEYLWCHLSGSIRSASGELTANYDSQTCSPGLQSLPVFWSVTKEINRVL